jgi:hypothetical protein
MGGQPASRSDENVLQLWDRGDGRFGGRIICGAVVRRRLEGCDSAEGVKTLATAFGERIDRIESVDPIPWRNIVSEDSSPSTPGPVSETSENLLINSILRLNAGQRKRLLDRIATRSLDERVQFIEICNDLASAASRTMLGASRVK